MILSLATALTSLIPTGNYVVKRITDYLTGGSKPVNAEEEIQQTNADVAKLQALAALDGTAPSYLWVNAIRQLQRPLVVFTVLFTWVLVTLRVVVIDMAAYVIVADAASSVWFYLFGDRTLMYSLDKYNKRISLK